MKGSEKLNTIEESISILKVLENQFRDWPNQKPLLIVQSIMEEMNSIKIPIVNRTSKKLSFYERALGRFLYKIFKNNS